MATVGGTYVSLCASCQNPGSAACKGCLLVTYCSKSCQTTHWSIHKHDCKSPLKRKDWEPQWVQQRRIPTFVGDEGPAQDAFGRKKYLWGNMPSIDVVQLDTNEGATYEQDLKVLFAASGDPRNVIETIASLPRSYTRKPSITMNDIDFDIVARNAVILLLAFTIDNEKEAAETVLHFWYSAFIRPVDFERVQSLRPLIEDVCSKIANRGAGSFQAKTFTFGECSLRVVLKKESWTTLLTFLCVPINLTTQRAHNDRIAVTKASHRVDYRHRDLVLHQPEHRICRERFCEDDILLPFSYSRKDFTIPNPSFYQTTEWPMMDSADPLGGWNFAGILQTRVGNAGNDLYGKLFVHVRSTLLLFKHRLSDTGTNFELHNLDASELPQTLAPTTFARIETSNICDQYCLGSMGTVGLLGPLLQKPAENPHATLVTLFMNAVAETDRYDFTATKAELAAFNRYPYVRNMLQSNPALGIHIMMGVMTLGKDVEKIFARYAKNHQFDKLAQVTGMRIKDHHTVIEKWPTRLKLTPGQYGADEDLATALAAGYNYMERYVEWTRAD